MCAEAKTLGSSSRDWPSAHTSVWWRASTTTTVPSHGWTHTHLCMQRHACTAKPRRQACFRQTWAHDHNDSDIWTRQTKHNHVSINMNHLFKELLNNTSYLLYRFQHSFFTNWLKIPTSHFLSKARCLCHPPPVRLGPAPAVQASLCLFCCESGQPDELWELSQGAEASLTLMTKSPISSPNLQWDLHYIHMHAHFSWLCWWQRAGWCLQMCSVPVMRTWNAHLLLAHLSPVIHSVLSNTWWLFLCVDFHFCTVSLHLCQLVLIWLMKHFHPSFSQQPFLIPKQAKINKINLKGQK